MRAYLLTLFLLLAYSKIYAQEETSQRGSLAIVSASTPFGSNSVVNFVRQSLDGGVSYSGDSYYSLGFSYAQPMRPRLHFEAGLEYCKHKILVEPAVQPGQMAEPYSKSISLINIPLTLRLDLGQHFFAQAGLMLDIDLQEDDSFDKQTGMGSLLGFGFKRNLGNGVGAFAAAYSKVHAMVPFVSESDDYSYKLIEAGLRFGIYYKFKN